MFSYPRYSCHPRQNYICVISTLKYKRNNIVTPRSTPCNRFVIFVSFLYGRIKR